MIIHFRSPDSAKRHWQLVVSCLSHFAHFWQFWNKFEVVKRVEIESEGLFFKVFVVVGVVFFSSEGNSHRIEKKINNVEVDVLRRIGRHDLTNARTHCLVTYQETWQRFSSLCQLITGERNALSCFVCVGGFLSEDLHLVEWFIFKRQQMESKVFMGHSRPILSLLSTFQYSKFIQWWQDLNRGPLASEATALPTEPQPLPLESKVCKWHFIINTN